MNYKKEIRKCKHCDNHLEENAHKLKKFCSSQCTIDYKQEQKYKDKKEGYDYIICPLCNKKYGEITLSHVKNHGFSNINDFLHDTGMNNCKSKSAIERMSGKNNPGYQHGGKLSPWSKNNTSLTEEQLLENYKKAEKSRTGKRPNELQYWLDKGYSEDEAKEKQSERQTTFSLDICIKKYGEIEGRKKWQERQDTWLKTLDNKSDEEKQIINFKKMSNGYSISKLENEVFIILKQSFPEIIPQFYIKDNIKGYSYDMKYNNKIIEFFGDFWHHNPKTYKEDWINPYTKQNSKEKWELDEHRINVAKNNNYEVLIIWESEYKENKEEVIKKCINFLNQ